MSDMQNKIAAIDALSQKARILPVIVINDPADVLPFADAMAAGGLKTLEVTLRSAHGLDAVRLLRKERPELTVGVGTVLDTHMFDAAVEAGAQFIVTPGCTDEILEAGVKSDVPLLPGIATPSDIMRAYRLGYRRFKLFPANVYGGIDALKAFAGPFGDLRFCPTGGVNPGNVKAYFQQSNVMCVGGSWMLPSDAIKARDWTKIEQLCREALAALD
ncbi:keto-hydroxyglutarate-aldolase/keto-deoxy-phosphogluconate aldolase [Pseudomonas sp. LTJR-52]|uniref:bifunctional 4-hydroxy-2-oxoglutarate aldolase/2-dehydro-3-deoxy-phosphogluconate aldolase n=1 Tax=Pseudomonas sp. LTJR-52 TaxID=2479392 RepID=UPI000EFCA596|nr:keto-hydroxyglutarate-aldolase/keto-deoxy-phosphogluconate aldolase [Pseudomonas sp. LTJR-52]